MVKAGNGLLPSPLPLKTKQKCSGQFLPLQIENERSPTFVSSFMHVAGMGRFSAEKVPFLTLITLRLPKFCNFRTVGTVPVPELRKSVLRGREEEREGVELWWYSTSLKVTKLLTHLY